MERQGSSVRLWGTRGDSNDVKNPKFRGRFPPGAGRGLGTGLFAYYTGFSTSAFAPSGGPDELKYLPSNATLVAFADVHEVMTSEVRQKLQSGLPFHGQGQRSFEDETGINIETDVDRVVFGLTPLLDAAQQGTPSGLVVARGRFNTVKIESGCESRGARIEDYKGKRIITADRPHPASPADPPAATASHSVAPLDSVSIAFIEPGSSPWGSPRWCGGHRFEGRRR